MDAKSKEIYKLVESVLGNEDLVFFTYKKLQSFTSLSLAEIRTVINILCEFNLMYPKKKMGLFKNLNVTRLYNQTKFSKSIEGDFVTFRTDTITVEFDRFEYELLEHLPTTGELLDASLIITIVVLSHFQANFYYEKTFEVTESSRILQVRRALTCSDDRLYFKVYYEAPKLVIYR